MKLSNEETMKELNKEEQLKVFAMYWGCEYSHCHSAGDIDYINKEFFETYVDEDLDYILNDPKLHLTPLSEINDEHAVEVAKLARCFEMSNKRLIHAGKGVLKSIFKYHFEYECSRECRVHDVHYIIQYLISKGYAVPLWFGIGHPENGKTAIELGIAISKNEVKYPFMRKLYYIRIESHLGYYSFYSVESINRYDAGILARKQFAKDFGGTFKNCRVGYVWEADKTHLDCTKGMKISDEVINEPLFHNTHI